MQKDNFDFKEGETLLVDKPLHWTSFDVVNKLRWKLRKKYNIKKFKVGHAGTLDPLATGLLIICTGKNTKLSESLTAENKTYTGTFLLGKTTPSYDLETEFNQTFDISHILKEDIIQTAQNMEGAQKQIPPIFSAKKINGKPAYLSARKGKDLELEANDIVIESFQITDIRMPEIDFKVTCSKGTYIRSLANDFGKALQSGATLIALRRTHSGSFSIENSESVEYWLNKIEEVTLSE
ncbi:MAG: tRNA pseudouridine(55) synthase TruB [Brumimicrobium sp.]|nr:tRNA pseudouridine(55) synthase TruB [Brumimicrobium sp.]